MQLFRILVISVFIVTAMTGCQTTRLAFTPSEPYDEKAFAWSTVRGTGSIEGQAFLKTMGGDVKLAAGNEVVLVPINDYTTELYEAAMSGLYSSINKDPRYEKHRRTTTADADGRFRFTDLPQGEWYIMSSVTWLAPSYGMQGGVVGKATTSYEGRSTQVILTR